MVNNSSNINKPKESFNSVGRQFLQQKCYPSLLKLSFVFFILEELLAITVKTFFWFVDIGGIVDHHCSNSPISTNQKRV
jgi:hypothetical protein